jgi:molybdopterin adenylyltransferase
MGFFPYTVNPPTAIHAVRAGGAARETKMSSGERTPPQLCRHAGSVDLVALTAKILTISDSVSRGERQDRSGEAVAEALLAHGFEVVDRRVVPDGMATVTEALTALSDRFGGLVVTTGGTGFSPTDLTPEATRQVLEREAPGLAEAMRAISPLGRLSRGIAGTVGQCLVLNLPGSPKGAIESLEAVLDVLGHALELLLGGRPH